MISLRVKIRSAHIRSQRLIACLLLAAWRSSAFIATPLLRVKRLARSETPLGKGTTATPTIGKLNVIPEALQNEMSNGIFGLGSTTSSPVLSAFLTVSIAMTHSAASTKGFTAPPSGSSAENTILSTLLLDPFVESEVLNDLAHVALDLSSFFVMGNSWKLAIVVLGRLFSLGADWLPDHSLFPEEWIFQLTMLGVAISSFALKHGNFGIWVLSGNFTDQGRLANLQDAKAFSLLFQSTTDLTWWQYLIWRQSVPAGASNDKMNATSLIHWINLPEDTELPNDQVLWLYDGTLQVSHHVCQSVENFDGQTNTVSDCTVSHSLERQAFDNTGKNPFLYVLNEHLLSPTEVERVAASSTVVKTTSPSRFLVINPAALNTMMERDAGVEQTFRPWMLRIVQDKLKWALSRPHQSPSLTPSTGNQNWTVGEAAN